MNEIKLLENATGIEILKALYTEKEFHSVKGKIYV
jgi:hypothetical protein